MVNGDLKLGIRETGILEMATAELGITESVRSGKGNQMVVKQTKKIKERSFLTAAKPYKVSMSAVGEEDSLTF